MKLSSTHQVMVNSDDVNIMGEGVHIIEKRPEALLVSSKEIVPKMTIDKSKYIFVSLDQNAGRCQYIKIDGNSFERVDEFRYMGTT